MVIVCFIPNSVLSAHLNVSPSKILNYLREEAGAKEATYLRPGEGVGKGKKYCHVRLVDPKVDVPTIEKKWANSFSQVYPVWVEEGAEPNS